MSEDVPPARTTRPGDDGLPAARRGRTARRAGFIVLSAFLLLAGVGLLGVRDRSVTVGEPGGVRMTVTWAAVSRPGLATNYAVEIVSPGGFDGPVVLEVSDDFLARFDENGLDPDPSAATNDGDFTRWEFDPPDGDTLAVSFDARLEPGVQWPFEGTTRLELDDGSWLSVDHRTWVLP